MKKLVLLILVFSLALSSLLFAGVTAVAETPSSYDYAVAYAQNHARRDILSGGEAAAANTLTAALTTFGYQVETPAFRYYGQSADGEKIAYDYKHVLGFKDNGKGKCVLIGCYYGGYEPVDSYGVGVGATAALSVGTLLSVARVLASAASEYDIVVAFWGGLEVFGDFRVKDCGVETDKIALYVNLDGVGVGDRDYLYADDVPRAQEEYFRKVIGEIGADISAPPVYKRQAALSYGDRDSYAYSHLGLLGANRFFMAENVPCVNFVGGAWEYDCGLYRYSGKGDIEGTSLDTFESIDGLNGGAAKTKARLDAAANVIVRGVTGEGLSAALDKAAKETSALDLSSSLAVCLISLIGTALLIAFLIILYVKQGKDRKDTVWAPDLNDRKEDPYEEFHNTQGEESDQTPSSDDDDDDVFRF